MIESKKRDLSILQKLMMSLISIVLFFTIAEVILRAINFKYSLCKDVPTVAQSRIMTKRIFGPSCIPSDILGYELEPNFIGENWDTWIIVNSNGFRDKEFPIQKDRDTLTFGVKVRLEDTYTKRLECMLNDNGEMKHFEALNAGCAGYTSFMGLKLLEKKDLLSYKPDVVTVYFGLDDQYMWYALSDSNSYKPRMLNKNFMKSRLYSFLWQMIAEKVLKDNIRLTGRVGKLTIRVTQEEFEKNLKKINNLLKNHKVKVIFMTCPVKPELFPQDQYQSLASVM